MNDPAAARAIVDEVQDLFQRHGDSEYGGEAVTQQQHALQAAYLAERCASPPSLIVAALLHDVGHLLHDLPVDAPDRGIDDVHEQLGARWLQQRFGPEVVEPVRLHVAAKRFLCTIEPEYLETLSEPSKTSLQLQGGLMSADERQEFARNAHYEAALALRRFDDGAKVVDAPAPPLQDYMRYIEQVARPAAPADKRGSV